MTTNVRVPVGVTTSFRQQLVLIARSGRWLIAVGAVVLALIGVERGDLDWSREGFFMLATIALAVGPVWAMLVWAGEMPLRRFHRSLPVSRAAHDLARVAVGALFLVAFSTVAAAAMLARMPPDPGVITGQTWATFFAGPLLFYFIATAFVLWSDSRVVLWVTVAIFAMAGGAAFDLPGMRAPMMAAVEGRWGVEAAVFGALPREDLTGEFRPTGMWLVLSIVLTLFTAMWRPADLARLVTQRAARG